MRLADGCSHLLSFVGLVTALGTNITAIVVQSVLFRAHQPRGCFNYYEAALLMAGRVVGCIRLLNLGRNLGHSYIFVPLGHAAFRQRVFWGKSPLPVSRMSSGHLYYSTSSSGGGEEGENGEEESEEGEGSEKEGDIIQGSLHQQYALAPVAIPDIFPEVPVLPISRNPIFPKFVKLLEVSGYSEPLPLFSMQRFVNDVILSVYYLDV